MNNLSTKIILINQYFRLFFNFYTPPNSNICIHQVSRHYYRDYYGGGCDSSNDGSDGGDSDGDGGDSDGGDGHFE